MLLVLGNKAFKTKFRKFQTAQSVALFATPPRTWRTQNPMVKPSGLGTNLGFVTKPATSAARAVPKMAVLKDIMASKTHK